MCFPNMKHSPLTKNNLSEDLNMNYMMAKGTNILKTMLISAPLIPLQYLGIIIVGRKRSGTLAQTDRRQLYKLLHAKH